MQKNFLGKLKSLKKELLEAFNEDDVRNLAELMSKLAHYHYNKKKYFMVGKEKEIYNFLITNGYNPFTVYRWMLLERVPEDIRFQIKQKQITQKRAIAIAFKRRHETNETLAESIRDVGLQLIARM